MNPKKSSLSTRLMARVRACAILFLDVESSRNRISEIASDLGIEIGEASIVYTIGALKAGIRRGLARNYAQALDNLEREQAGDRGNPLTRTLSAEKTALRISDLSHETGASFNKGQIDAVHLSWAKMDKQPLGPLVRELKVFFETVKGPEKAGKAPKTDISSGLGKVFGTLYAEWEEREEESDPLSILTKKEKIELAGDRVEIKKNLTLFFADYKNRLSRTSRERLDELAGSTVDSAFLLSCEGRVGKTTKKLSRAARSLYANFPHKVGLTIQEFIALVRKYCKK